MRRVVTMVFALTLGLGACGSTSEEADHPTSGVSSTTPTGGQPTTSRLEPSTSTTVPTIPPTTIATATTPLAPPETPTVLVIGPDSVGSVTIGDTVERAMTAFAEILGEPDEDVLEEWTESIGIKNGLPADLYFRQVTWLKAGLAVAFSDGVRWSDGRDGPMLIRWEAITPAPGSSLRIATPEGVGIGTPAGDLSETYGKSLSFREDEYDGWRGSLTTAISGASPDLAGLVFELTGDPADLGTVIDFIWSGAGVAP